MFKGLFRYCVIVLALVCVPMARADMTISASVGFNSGNAGSANRIFKQGCWAPVYVQITNGSGARAETIGAGSSVVVQMTDSDGMDSRFSQQIPADVAPGNTMDVVVLARPFSANEEISVSVVDAEGHTLGQSTVALRNSHVALASHSVLYLALGSNLPSLDQALRGLISKDKNAEGDAAVAYDARIYNDAYLTQASELPRRWFGYQGVDVIVLTTANKQFLEDLLQRTNKDRLDALRDWVRHGGHIIVSVGGSNVEERVDLLERLDIIDVTMEKKPASSPSLDTVLPWIREARIEVKPGTPDLAAAKGKQIDVAWFKIKANSLHRPVVGIKRPSATSGNADEGDRALSYDAPYGLGRVMLVAFELDEAPFTNWAGQEAFWQNLQKGVRFAPQVPETATDKSQFSSIAGYQEEASDLNTKLLRGLETIEDVPVVSFGWVALFIILYIIVVGPLDYIILKKLVKRLELTWITFPVIVVTISLAAYVVAYLLKGNDLKINKLDVVDIFLDAEGDKDAAPGQHTKLVARDAVGTTWFTLFSPQIKRYTIGVDLNRGRSGSDDGWVPGAVDPREVYGTDANPYGMAVGTMNRPENFPDAGQHGTGGLFRWPCRYEEDGSGMTSVPIQVWQTKTFTASWQASLAGKKLLTAQLHREGTTDQDLKLVGWIESGLPVTLTEARLLYNERAYDVKTLAPGSRVVIDEMRTGRETADHWLKDRFDTPYFKAPKSRDRFGATSTPEAPCSYAKAILFGTAGIGSSQNLSIGGGFRTLDQSWRLNDTQRRREEAILVGRVASSNDRAEDITAGVGCPTRLWLDRLPKSGGDRPSLSGKLTQDTIVRIFIPVESKKP